jgi:CheY-like chemotaxis protein
MELRYATVLLVDDEPLLLDIFREWLEEENCHVLTAGDGAAALRILHQHHVDLIVSDVHMPVMDGILLLKNLATHSSISQNNYPPQMIFISGFTDVEPREAYHLGIEAIVQKPMKHAELMGAVRRTLRPPEEKWAEFPTPGALPLHIPLPSVSAAIEQGRVAFGRGGFCLRCASPIREGPVQFDLGFEGEKVTFAGHGLIRWAEPNECLLGVEILNLDEPCRKWAIAVIAVNASSCYIPRVPLSTVPKSRAAK